MHEVRSNSRMVTFFFSHCSKCKYDFTTKCVKKIEQSYLDDETNLPCETCKNRVDGRAYGCLCEEEVTSDEIANKKCKYFEKEE